MGSLHNLPTPEWCRRTRKRYVQILPRTSSTIAGGRGCNIFVPVWGGNGTKIASTGDMFDQPPGQMRSIRGKLAHHVGDHVVSSPEEAVLVTSSGTKSSYPRPPQSLNPSQAVPKGNGYRLVCDFKAVNLQIVSVAALPMLLEEQTSALAGAALFKAVDLNQSYWKMPLTANSQELFTFICDAEGSEHADVNALRSDECNLVLPGNAGEDNR